MALVALVCAGCEASDAMLTDAGAPVDAGPACTELLYERDGTSITRWPEPALLVDDATTETGRRLQFDPERYPDLVARLGSYLPTLTIDLAEIDGFGVNAEAFFQFGRAFDVDAIPRDGLGLVVIEPGPARVVPVIATTTDEGTTLLLAPLTPLPPHARAAAFVTRALTDAARGCLEPSRDMRALIASPDDDTRAAIDALVALGAIASADELVAISAFPTQSIEEDSVAVATDVATHEHVYASTPTCVEETSWTRCETTFEAYDYRDPEDGVMRRPRGEPATPRATYTVPNTMWLPREGEGPFPVLVFGHGLTGSRSQAERLGRFAAPLGYATVAIDALQHGEHPTTEGAERSDVQTLLAFFGVGDLDERALEAARLREHFRQSTWDKLQLTQLLVSDPDLDDDGAPELDVTRIVYLGVSLGGLMGPELLALSSDYGAGLLVVPGGRVSAIISDGAQFGSLIDLLRPRGATRGDVRRFFPILQTVLDRGDPASYGPHLLRDRLPVAGATTPSILVGVVLDDEIVPNVASYALARAIGVPIVEPLLRPEPGFELVRGPIEGNFADGAASGGLLQFDLVAEGERATHGNVADSEVGVAAWLDFLDTHYRTGLARIRDPYEAIGLAHAM
ncbi:hypothetical protein [Sandaracinus amylolyticus]|uniref:Putative alpha/beta hydrolase superfamily protein n=1 Tax=Sandaracinus amylolyticus TaxID=927083 RepID=A0A0F6YJD2_9BACT|nr:hypothetical protein [Sandaracinus amylolyticus]AKF06885.1 Putative alpha/beta hydrolase superfamily protein [Sandaracinus amylolyticus]